VLSCEKLNTISAVLKKVRYSSLATRERAICIHLDKKPA
jgi:hypothetical protein